MNLTTVLLIIFLLPSILFFLAGIVTAVRGRRYMDYSILCLMNNHKDCTAHLDCMCPHHSEVIFKEITERLTS